MENAEGKHPSVSLANPLSDSPNCPQDAYSPPGVVYEGFLETRAGSPLSKLPGEEFFDPASPLYRSDD